MKSSKRESFKDINILGVMKEVFNDPYGLSYKVDLGWENVELRCDVWVMKL